MTKCTCLREVDFTDSIIRDVLISGIADLDIRREVLGMRAILERAVNDVISLVEGKEMPTNSLPSSASGISSFKRSRPVSAAQPPPSDRSQTALCPDCKQTFALFSEGARGWNTRPHRQCIKCYRGRRGRRSGESPHVDANLRDGCRVRASVIAERLMWGQPVVTPASPTPQTSSTWSIPS